jgi:hypothetical protein
MCVCVCGCGCVCVCVCTYIYIYIYIYMYTYIYIYIYIYIYMTGLPQQTHYMPQQQYCAYMTHMYPPPHMYRATATDPLYLATTILCSTLPATAFPVYGRAGFSRSLLLIFNTRIGLIYLHTTMSLLLLQEGSQGSLSCLALFHEAGPGGLRRDARFPSGTFGPYADYSSGPMRHVIGPCGRHLDGL